MKQEDILKPIKIYQWPSTEIKQKYVGPGW